MFITKKKHNAIISKLEEHNESLKGRISSLTKEQTSADLEIMDLQNRLYRAVEGLTSNEVQILKAKLAGNYIYTVTCGADVKTVRVPMNSKNWDGDAKRMAGYSRKDNCKAERWKI